MSNATLVALRTEIELTRERFQRLLVTIHPDVLPFTSKEPGWSNAEVLYRISISPLYIRSVIKRNSASWSHLLLSKLVTGTLIDWTNELSIHAAVRNVTFLLPRNMNTTAGWRWICWKALQRLTLAKW